MQAFPFTTTQLSNAGPGCLQRARYSDESPVLSAAIPRSSPSLVPSQSAPAMCLSECEHSAGHCPPRHCAQLAVASNTTVTYPLLLQPLHVSSVCNLRCCINFSPLPSRCHPPLHSACRRRWPSCLLACVLVFSFAFSSVLFRPDRTGILTFIVVELRDSVSIRLQHPSSNHDSCFFNLLKRTVLEF